MRGIFVDVENELADIAREVELLGAALTIFQQEAAHAEPAWRWLAVQGLASGIEKIYTGCERIMGMIATDMDGARIEAADGWHISLLKRMAHPFPGIREAVISEECYRLLDQLRSFRHRQRNTYGLLLDEDIVALRAELTARAFARFRSEVSAFARSE